jgi:O-antigen ligase
MQSVESNEKITQHPYEMDVFASKILCWLGLAFLVFGTIISPNQRIVITAVSVLILFLSSRSRSAFDSILNASFFLLSFNLVGFDFTDILFPFILISGITFRHLKIKRSGRRTEFSALSILFLGSYLISNIFSQGVFSEIAKFTINLTFFTLLQIYFTEAKRIENFLKYTLFGILVSSCFAFLSLLFSIPQLPIFMDYIRDNRYFALIGDPNILSVMTVPFLIWLVDETFRRNILSYSKSIKVLIILFLLLQIIATQSRSGWLNLLSSLFIYFFIEFLRARFANIAIASLVVTTLFIGFIGLAVQFQVADEIIYRAELIVRPDSSAEQERSDFFYTRSALEIASKQPLGLGTGRTERDPRMPKNADGTTLGAHNSYVQVLSDNGWSTFIFFIALLIAFMASVTSKFRENTFKVSNQVLLASFVGLLVNGMFHDLVLWTSAWILPALIVAQATWKHRKHTGLLS